MNLNIFLNLFEQTTKNNFKILFFLFCLWFFWFKNLWIIRICSLGVGCWIWWERYSPNMPILEVEFSREGYKIRKFFCLKINIPKGNYFENWCNGEVSKSAKIWLSKSIFYFKNHLNLSKKYFIEEYQYRCTFFVKIIFCWLQFQNHFVT